MWSRQIISTTLLLLFLKLQFCHNKWKDFRNFLTPYNELWESLQDSLHLSSSSPSCTIVLRQNLSPSNNEKDHFYFTLSLLGMKINCLLKARIIRYSLWFFSLSSALLFSFKNLLKRIKRIFKPAKISQEGFKIKKAHFQHDQKFVKGFSSDSNLAILSSILHSSALWDNKAHDWENLLGKDKKKREIIFQFLIKINC